MDSEITKLGLAQAKEAGELAAETGALWESLQTSSGRHERVDLSSKRKTTKRHPIFRQSCCPYVSILSPNHSQVR